MRKVLMTLVFAVLVLAAAVSTQVGFFVVPAGASVHAHLPEAKLVPVDMAATPAAEARGEADDGVVYLITRAADMRFVDSADAICRRQFADSDVGCRTLVRGWVMRESRVLVTLPYSEALWRMTATGR